MRALHRGRPRLSKLGKVRNESKDQPLKHSVALFAASVCNSYCRYEGTDSLQLEERSSVIPLDL